MKIILTSVFVDDQDKALKFYTEKLGFIKTRHACWRFQMAHRSIT